MTNGRYETGTSLMNGRVDPGEPGGAMNRAERLIHLELASLVMYAQYLKPGFPDVNKMKTSGASGGSNDSNSDEYEPTGGKKGKATGKMPALKQLQRGSEPCKDCKFFHQRPNFAPFPSPSFLHSSEVPQFLLTILCVDLAVARVGQCIVASFRLPLSHLRTLCPSAFLPP